MIDWIICFTCTFPYWWFVLLIFPLQHPSVSFLSHPGGRWGEAVRDVRRSAAHNAVQQPCSHRRKHIFTSWHFDFDSVANKSLRSIFFLPSSSRAQLPRTWQNPCLQMMVSFLSWPSAGELSYYCVTLVKICCLWELDSLTFTPLGGPEDRMHAGGDILQDCSSEHSSLTKTESDPPGDLSLPGKKSSEKREYEGNLQARSDGKERKGNKYTQRDYIQGKTIHIF